MDEGRGALLLKLSLLLLSLNFFSPFAHLKVGFNAGRGVKNVWSFLPAKTNLNSLHFLHLIIHLHLLARFSLVVIEKTLELDRLEEVKVVTRFP